MHWSEHVDSVSNGYLRQLLGDGAYALTTALPVALLALGLVTQAVSAVLILANVHADDQAAFEALYDPDGSHPSVRGSYLVSCVFYGVLTGRPSVGLPYSPAEIGAEARVYLQVMADRAVGEAAKDK